MSIRHHHESGFTLAQLLVVMAGLLILMTLVIPTLQSVTRRGDEVSAIDSLRMLNEMEGQYRSNYPLHGFACTLPMLGGKTGSGQPSAEAAQLIPGDLASGSKAGYTFTLSCSNKVTNNIGQAKGYQIHAVPDSVGHSGSRGFCTDEDGQIRYDPKGGTNCTELLQ